MASREHCTSQETTYSLDKRLHDIQKAVAETQNAILSQNNAVHCVLRCMPYSYDKLSTPSEYRPALAKPTHWTSRISSQVSSSRLRDGTTQRRSNTAGEVLREREESPEPQSLFEMSADFFPEVYTTDQRLPRSSLVVISSFEEHLGENSRRNLYRLFYLKSPRQWFRINISLKIPHRSKYWAASKTSTNEVNSAESWTREAYAPLPYSLISQIQPALLRFSSVEQVSASVSTITRLWGIKIESPAYLCSRKERDAT